MKKNLILVGVVFAIGVIIGYRLSKPRVREEGKRVAPREKISFKKRPGVLMISDFESKQEMTRWEARSAKIEQSDFFHTHGNYGAKVVLRGQVTCPKVMIEDFFEAGLGRRLGNWKGYEVLKFDLYNPTENNTRIILQIKDADGTRYKRNIYLAPKEKTPVEIYIDELKEILDVSKIRQFNLFRWKPSNSFVFYIDNVRVEKFASKEESKAEVKEKIAKEIKEIKKKAEEPPEEKTYRIGIETSVRKVFKEWDRFKGKWDNNVNLYSAKNEYESFQVAIYSFYKPLENVKIEINDLVTKDGSRISKENISWYLVSYVKTKRPDYTVPYVGYWPDPLPKVEKFNVEKDKVQPIWVTIYVPPQTKAGIYQGSLKIIPENDEVKTVDIKLKIWDFTLPKTPHLKTAFDFYPWRLKFGHQFLKKLSGNDYNSAVRNLSIDYYLAMLKYKISPILNINPMALDFKQEISLYLKNGLNAFGIGKYNGTAGNNWPKDSQQLKNLIPLYRKYAENLKKLGLINLAYIYTYDEPKVGDSHVKEITEMVHQADPDLKNLIVIHDLPNLEGYRDWFKDIDIICVRNVALSRFMVRKLKELNKEIWFYVSGPSYPYPTLVIDFPAISYRVLPWMAWKYGIKGFLYWCVNFWTKDPWKDPMNTKWGQNGNGSLFYPGENGPVGSIRLEVLRDGIEDYEYLYILKNLYIKNRDRIGPSLKEEIEDALNVPDEIVRSMGSYTRDSGVLEEERIKIAELIEKLK